MSDSSSAPAPAVVQLSSWKFIALCLALSAAVLWIGRTTPFSPTFIGAEVLLTILCLFLFGSFKYQIHKNALTYGAVIVIGCTFFTGWWPASGLRAAYQAEGLSAFVEFSKHHFLSLHGLDDLIHTDTMLFILGLTFFVSVVAQSRILESISFSVLKKNKGYVLPTVAILAGLVALASGILDGVSMIGLMIRTLVIILFLAKADEESIIFAVIISTIITTVCGMWLAYGEPPNLIMKANLHPYLTNGFFLRYCLPAAFGAYLIVFWNLRKRLKGQRVDVATLDVLDLHTADARFLQASRHGEVLTPVEFIEEKSAELGSHLEPVLARLHKGEPLGEALVHENVAAPVRLRLLADFTSDELADALDEHYQQMAVGKQESAKSHEKIYAGLESVRKQRQRAQLISGLSFIPFVGLLITHAVNHEFPLFWASFAGFAVALFGIYSIPKMRKLAIGEAIHEYKEYLFLFPLFLSITLLQRSGFFSQLTVWLHHGIEQLGVKVVAFIQFAAACFLSALLDNNVVADFASRALHGLEIGVLHLFSMAQIAGYAAGGCWTHIGSAQSVVAFAFIRKEVNAHYTPVQWMKAMTVVILQIFVLMAALIYIEGSLLSVLH